MPRGKIWTDLDDTTLRALHSKGRTQAEVAKQMSRPVDTISAKSKLLGLGWDRTSTEAAVKKARLSGEDRRKALVERHLEQAERLLDILEAPKFRTKIKAAGGAERVVDLDFIPPDEHLKLITALSTHEAALIKLELHDRPRPDQLEISGPDGVPLVTDGRNALLAALQSLNKTPDTPPAIQK